jgi:hypothetical protein
MTLGPSKNEFFTTTGVTGALAAALDIFVASTRP